MSTCEKNDNDEIDNVGEVISHIADDGDEYKMILVNGRAGLLDSDTRRELIATFIHVYPALVRRFNPNSPRVVEVRIDDDDSEDMPPGHTCDRSITLSAAWLRRHPHDTDVLTHELMHVVQAYGQMHANPCWLVEGLADYVRAKYGRNNETARWSVCATSSSSSAHYTHGYRATAGFLVWLDERSVNGRIIEDLDSICREGSYNHELTWLELTEKSLDDLWNEYSNNNHESSRIQSHIVPNGNYRILNPQSGKYLDAVSFAVANLDSQKVCVSISDRESSTQTWRLEHIDDGMYKIENSGISEHVLDVDSSHDADGARVQMWPSNDTLAQRWRFVLVNANADADSGDTVKIVSSLGGRRVLTAVVDTRSQASPSLHIWEDNQSSMQIWKLERI